MLSNPLASPESMSMDTMGNMEPTVIRMMTVHLQPRGTRKDSQTPDACDDDKSSLRLELPYTHTMSEVSAELLRAYTTPSTTERLRAWLGMSTPNTADVQPANGPVVQLYVQDGNKEFVAVPPASRLEELLPTVRSADDSSEVELTLFYANEAAFGCPCCAACCYCCAACACCAACCA